MSKRLERFRINAPGVVADAIDGEIIGINLETGCYYSLPGTAGKIWTLVRRRLTVGRIVEALQRAYEGDAVAIERDVVGFITVLLEEGLVVPDDGESSAAESIEPGLPAGRSPFVPPALEKYDDMREFLLVDPIHEVDVTDWPHVRRRPESG